MEDNVAASSTWNMNIRPLERECFTGFNLSKRQFHHFNADSDLWTIFFQILTDDIIDFLIAETNTYASQTLQQANLSIHSRIKRWKPVTRTEMR